MRENIVKYILLNFCLISITLGQVNPSYSGRANLFSYDSTRQFFSSSQFITTADGILDAKEYFVGPGDKLLFIISGVNPLTFSSIIDYEGNVFIDQVGVINVQNLTLSEARTKIKEKLFNYYKNSNIEITLTEFKKIKVSLIGNVIKPYTYNLNGNTRLLELIMNSYGVLLNSDMRNIEVNDNTGKIKKYDLTKYMRLGDKTQNPFLREGTVINIKRVDKTVAVWGNVVYPGTYEFKEDETIKDLIVLCGGLEYKAREDSIEHIKFTEDTKSAEIDYYNYEWLLGNSIKLKPGDKIVVREKPEFMVDRFVRVVGFVNSPGYYRIEKDRTTLKELINNLVGGFREKASLKDAYVIRTRSEEKPDLEFIRLKGLQRSDMSDDEYDYLKAMSRHEKGRMVIDFEKLFLLNDESENIVLKEGDEIYVPEKVNYITVVGQAVKQGNIVFNPKLTVEDYIKLAGGYSWRAIESEVRVIKANTKEWIEADEITELQPGDIIWIPEDPPPPKFWEVFKDTMLVVGQVAALITAVVAVIISARN
ncbi:MAG TPA: SLBB domain-containing protein [Melioribacteraceae bacterium]|nr:SLBB domain-containing protein [Melioribacteraceae bacterium]